MAQALHDGAVRHEGGSHGGARHRALMAGVDRALADLRWPRAPGDVAVSIAHSLRRSRRRLAAGLAARDVEALHSARTAAVRLMVQLEAVAALRGGFGGRIAHLDALRDVLGEHHDLAILGARIAAQGDGGQGDGGQDASADVKAEVLAVLGARQKRLEREAARLHAVVHATPAGRLRKKVLRRLAGLRIGTA
jgi:CHAD domain-containing protein